MKLKQWVVAASLVAAGAAAWALPSVQDVESAVKQGQYAQAETMMKEVVTAKPGSARGHYLYAEILAHNARFAQAAEEAKAAERLDPAIGFTQPDKFRSFQELLAREQRAEAARAAGTAARTSTVAADAGPRVTPVTRDNAAPQRSGLPGWIWIVGLAVIGYFLWRGFSRSRAASAAAGTGLAPTAYGGAPGGAPQPGFGSGYGPGGAAPGYGPAGYPQGGPGYAPPQRGGPGWLGTGLAAAGGVAAGMALDRMMHPGSNAGQPAAYGDGATMGDLSGASTFNNGGGDEAARQLEDRSVDFGTGGNEWGGDAGASFDGGGGGGSDDGSWD